ncbi:MAG: cyclase family protein [Armatimonadetes bacterium]|nr:cyclase family protein [Armatimonadota bacterium]
MQDARRTTRVDASVPLGPGTPVWPTDPPVELQRISSIRNGDSCNLTHARFSAHAGTHLDAPCHFVDCDEGVDTLNLDTLIGPAYVLDLAQHRGAIEANDLQNTPECQRLILRTSNTTRGLMRIRDFTRDYAHIGESGARWLVERGIRLIGVDYLSIEGFNTGSHTVHDIVLGARVIAVEGLDLTDVGGGWWKMICLPAKFAGADGSPARVVFERES